MRALLLLLLPINVYAQALNFRADERLLFYPSLGSQVDSGAAWEIDIRGYVYEPDRRPVLVPALRKALGLSLSDMTRAEREVFTERARAFLADNERGKVVWIRLGEKAYEVGETKANGHFNGSIRISNAEVELAQNAAPREPPGLSFYTAMGRGADRIVAGRAHLVPPTGISVISDIDDTIKISEVGNRSALIRNTFLKPFTAVSGMAEVYQAWATNSDARFHYVSASPWQLYSALDPFIRSNNFPAGTFHLKSFRWKDEDFFNLFTASSIYKPSVIEPLLRKFPGRRFVLVGDSGEADPEIYADCARMFPRQIIRILIRDTTDEGPEAKRYATAFQGLPKTLWRIFKHPAQIRDAIP